MTASNSTETATETQTEARPVGRPMTHVTEKQIDQAAVLYMGGLSVEKIVARKQSGKKTAKAWASVQVANLYHHLRQRDDVVMRGKGRQGLTEEQKELVVTSYKDGMTLTAIQGLKALERRVGNTRVKWSLPTLSKAVKAAGITPRRGRPANPAAEEVEEEAAE